MSFGEIGYREREGEFHRGKGEKILSLQLRERKYKQE